MQNNALNFECLRNQSDKGFLAVFEGKSSLFMCTGIVQKIVELCFVL